MITKNQLDLNNIYSIINTKKMDKKKQLGQFYTTNYKYILSNIKIKSKTTKIIEPFCGNGDLIKMIDKNKYNIECYDIDPKKDYIIKRDTIMNPPDYSGAFIITNPPYLSRNKSIDKSIFDYHDVNDLYKCHIKNLLTNNPTGGIIIIPLNFFCSIRPMDVKLRKAFLNTYIIKQLNIFEEQVFNDTSYTVCSFRYDYKPNSNRSIPITLFPSLKTITFCLNDNNNYTIGGEIYNIKPNPKYTISRLLINGVPNTNLLLKAIDDNECSVISLTYISDTDIYYGKVSSRTYATLIIEPEISKDTQITLAKKFNEYINDKRNTYNSLFLTNYRENSRKRISFQLAYKIVGMLLECLDD